MENTIHGAWVSITDENYEESQGWAFRLSLLLKRDKSGIVLFLGDENKPGGVAQGEHLCDAVRGDLAVIEQTPKTSTFACSINTENVTEINI